MDLNSLLLAGGLQPLESKAAAKFEPYLEQILRWNERMNLTAVRDPAGIVSRHFIESIACAQWLPAAIGSLLDFGSGAGFPGIPIALCRPEIAITLAESQTKKAGFLHEMVRVLGLRCKVWGRRAEDLREQFDCVVLRAVDRMEDAVAKSAELVRPGGWLAIMTTQSDLGNLKAMVGREFEWSDPRRMPGSGQRILGIGSKKGIPE